MMRRATALALLACAVCVTAWAETGFMPVDETIASVEEGLTQERREALEAGEVLQVEVKEERDDTEQRARGTVMVIIDRPADEVYDRICNLTDQHEYMPRVTSMTQYTESDNPMGQYFTLKVAFKTINYHILVRYDDEKRFLTWHLDDSRENDIAATTGFWYFKPWGDDKCLAVYHVYADTGMRLPKWLANWLMRRDMPGVPENLKKRAESDGTWKK
jgi:uncharacterized membrane protein